MVQRTRGRGEVIPRADQALVALRDCRWRVLIGARSGVKPFGASWQALAIVTAAIDALALFMTGQGDPASVKTSVPPSRGPMPSPMRPPTRLSDFPWVIIARVVCTLCPRRGQYRIVRLAERYGSDIELQRLLVILAGDCRSMQPGIKPRNS